MRLGLLFIVKIIHFKKYNIMSLMTDNQYRKRLLLVVTIAWLAIFLANENNVQLFSNYGYFFLVGVVGALVANSTGAGGGIIFIPFFTTVGLAINETLGTSILIQCFGMTAGAISWLSASKVVKTNSSHLNQLIRQLLVVCGLPSIFGVLAGQYWLVSENTSLMLDVFKALSIVFGVALLLITFNRHKQKHTRFSLVWYDVLLLIVLCFIGGVITAWISIGVGEVVATALILRRYPTMVAISMGVVVTAVTVLVAAYYHVVVIESINWAIILFTVPGAILGGTFAYLLSEKLGPVRLKVFFAIWIILTGFYM
jgi:uncharacterized membrane protein YfcA